MNTSTVTVRPTSQDRLAACIAHAGTVTAWFLAPLVVFLVVDREHRWARNQALQSLLWSLLGTLVSVLTCGLAIPVFLVWHIIAAVKTMNDGDYQYPLVGEAARRIVYGDA